VTATRAPAVRVDHLGKRYPAGAVALDDVSFEVAPGEIVGLLGRNGAGKSTAMKIMAGLLRPSAGTVQIAGHDVATAGPAAMAQLGFAPQGNTLDRQITVFDLVVFHLLYHGWGLRAARKRAAERLDAAGAGDLRDRLADQLSGGQLRRVLLAKATAHRPAVLVFDEPTAGMDVSGRQQCFAFLRDQAAGGDAVIVASHELDTMTTLCDRVVILERGRVLADGSPSNLVAALDGHIAVRIRGAGAGADFLKELEGHRETLATWSLGNDLYAYLQPERSSGPLPVVEHAASEAGFTIENFEVCARGLDLFFIRLDHSAVLGESVPSRNGRARHNGDRRKRPLVAAGRENG
jgi:ABC-type multidrug transport system ATPase subunit